ncbi:hypothetical protein, partial [Candidatus Avelusimicrobium stercoris]|uniref:hypothetical protein n=1 Tax=Candidatus Avelusimicrobium stercoris TaxID=1947924 RepID=UPI003D0B3B48
KKKKRNNPFTVNSQKDNDKNNIFCRYQNRGHSELVSESTSWVVVVKVQQQQPTTQSVDPEPY